MRFAHLIAVAATALLTVSAGAEVVTKNTAPRGDRTIVTSRGEDGRTRTESSSRALVPRSGHPGFPGREPLQFRAGAGVAAALQ